MQVVEMRRGEEGLPKYYAPEELAGYFRKRPGAVASRLFQVLSTSAGYLSGLLVDTLTGSLEESEVKRAAELRRTIVSLGPFFIKLGQALSIRPDILSPRAMVELQQLCDKAAGGAGARRASESDAAEAVASTRVEGRGRRKYPPSRSRRAPRRASRRRP